MPTAQPIKSGDAETHVTTSWFDEVTIETVYVGAVAPPLMAQAEQDMAKLLTEHPALYRLVDTIGLTSYDRAIRGGVAHLWTRFKAVGGREILFIAHEQILRMSGAVIGMNTAMPVKFFNSRAEALAYLATLPRK